MNVALDSLEVSAQGAAAGLVNPGLADALWSQVLSQLQARVAPQNYDMWLRPLECTSFAEMTLRLRAPNSYVRRWFEDKFLATASEQLAAICGETVAIEFEADGPSERTEAELPVEKIVAADRDQHSSRRVDTNSDAVSDAVISEEYPTAAVMPSPTSASTSPSDDAGLAPKANLNPRYTLDTFVAGPSNQLAFAASHAAGTTYPPKYNPIFICGGPGLGKTHLLHAIGHQQIGIRPDARVVYLSCESFMNEYVQAIRDDAMHQFRRRYREGIDVLLVDDVQFLARKQGTQDEFFHTFNALYDNQKQIVLTADRKPNEISDISDRLITRFKWGLLADVEPPELEVRIAILRKKAAVESIPLPDDVTQYIASSIKSNVRELEGALIRLAAYASLSNRTIDLAFAQETLGGAIARPREIITADIVIKAVASYYGVKTADLKSERRHKSIAGPRAVAMYLARHHTKDSYPDLGRAFGGKHHTTIISAVEKIATRLKEEAALRSELHAIESTFSK